MRLLGNFKDSASPFAVLVCFDTATNTPQFGFTYYGISTSDVDVVAVGGIQVPVIGQLDSLTFSSTRPQSGGGLIRRSITASIKSDGPFTHGIWTKKYYIGGQSDRDFYFGLYSTDHTTYYIDLVYACFYGYFKLNAGTSWDEKTETTNIDLIDQLLTLEDRPNFISTEVAANLDNTEWQSLMNLPMVLGNFTKYPMIGKTPFGGTGYAQSSTIVRNFASGIVTNDYSGSGYLYLGTSPYLAAHIGEVIKIRLNGTNEIISGTIVSDSSQYALSGLTRDTDFGTADFRSYKAGTVLSDPLSVDIELNSVQLTSDSLDKIIDDHCYLKFTADFWQLADVPITRPDCVKRLTGIVDPVLKVFGIEDIVYPVPDDNKTGLGITYENHDVQSGFTAPNAYLNAGVIAAPTTCTIYFRDVSVALVDAVNIPEGTGWMFFATLYENNGSDPAAISQDYYINAVDGTVIIADHLFYRVGSGYKQIPASEITSITYNCTDFGFTNLTRVRLARPPVLANPDSTLQVDNNFIFVDLENPLRINQVLNYLLGTAFPSTLLGNSITCVHDNAVSPVLGVVIVDEQLTDIIDGLCYETGYTIVYEHGLMELVSTPLASVSIGQWIDSGDKFAKVFPVDLLDSDTILDKSVKTTVGKLRTKIIDDYEVVPVFFNFSYNIGIGTDSSSSNARKLSSSAPLGQLDRVFNYTFKYVHDKESAAYCAMQFGMIGHAANVPETTRIYECELTYAGAKFEALDIVEFNNIDNVNGDGDISAPIYRDDADDLLYYKYTDAVPFILLPGLGIVETVEVIFDIVSMVRITVKQCQVQVVSNLKEVSQLIPEATLSDPLEDSTITDPSLHNDGGRSGLCLLESISYPDPVPSPSPITLDPSKAVANICCPNGSSIDTPQNLIKYVEYCVGPTKPDLTPVTFFARIVPQGVSINSIDNRSATIKGQISDFRGNNAIQIGQMVISSTDINKSENDTIAGVAFSVTNVDHHAMGHYDESPPLSHLSKEFDFANLVVDYTLFSGNGEAYKNLTSITLQIRIPYSWQTYQFIDFSHGGIHTPGVHSGDIVTEHASLVINFTVVLDPIIDIVES